MDIKHLINEPSAERDASSRTDEPYRTPRPSVATTSRQPAIFVDPNPGLHLRSPLLEGMECLGRGGDGWESAVGLCHGWIRDVLLTIADGRLEDARVALFAGCDFVEAHIVEIAAVSAHPETRQRQKLFWLEFNAAWLIVLGMQRAAITQDPAACQQLLWPVSLSRMAARIIELCDALEPYGVVDTSCGIWESSILEAIMQCGGEE